MFEPVHSVAESARPRDEAEGFQLSRGDALRQANYRRVLKSSMDRVEEGAILEIEEMNEELERVQSAVRLLGVKRREEAQEKEDSNLYDNMEAKLKAKALQEPS